MQENITNKENYISIPQMDRRAKTRKFYYN